MNNRLSLFTFICFLLLMFVSSSEAVFEDMEVGVRPQGMGGAFTAVADEATAIHWNPAGLAQLKQRHANTFYKQLFGNSGIHNVTLDVSIPYKKWGTFGLSYQQIGSEWQKERAITLSHGINLTKELAFGYNIIGYHLDVERFGSQMTYGVDLGFLATVYRRWRLGAFMHNINKPEFEGETNAKYDLPRLMSVGISYTPLSGIITSVDILKEIGEDTRFAFGQEFQILDPYLTVRAGVQTAPVRYSGGFTVSIVKGLHLDYAITNHEKLPMTHQFGIGYKF